MAAIIGVLGGAFDPPHLGHVLIPSYVLARGLAQRILVAPTFEHPLGKTSHPFTHRLAWTRAAMAIHGPAVEVTDLERRLHESRGGPSYTIDLLEAVAATHPEAVVRLVLGSDLLTETDRWQRFGEIEARFAPIVVPRGGTPAAGASGLPDISSTKIRALLGRADAAALNELATLVPASVLSMLLAPRRGTFWILGRGHVARHAEPWLLARGYQIRSISSRTLSATDRADVLREPPIGIWLLVADPALPEVCRALLELGLPRDVAVLHAAGSLRAHDPAALGMLAQAGIAVGTLHPICSLRGERAMGMLDRATFGIEGDEPARALAITAVGSQPWIDLEGLDGRKRRAYHAACSLAANHFAVLQDAATRTLIGLKIPADHAQRAIGVLMTSALDNLLALGLESGISGPVSRGDEATVRAHIEALDPATADLYRSLSSSLRDLLARTRNSPDATG